MSSFFVVVVVVDVARKLVNTSHVYVCTFHVNLGPSQSLPCFCLHPGTRLIKLEVWTLCTDVIRLLATVAIRHLGGQAAGFVDALMHVLRLTVEWFLSRENSRWLGRKRIRNSV